jgi:hypothetical protein
MWVTIHQPLHGKSAESLPLCCPLQSGKKLNKTTGEFRVGENHKKPHNKISGNKRQQHKFHVLNQIPSCYKQPFKQYPTIIYKP